MLQKISRTAKLESAYGLVQFIWQSSEFFSPNYFQIGHHVVLLHIIIGLSEVQLASVKNTIILFVCPSKMLHKHCFYFLLELTMVSRETGNNSYAKLWRDKQIVLWYF